MSRPVHAFRCTGCGHVVYPRRLVCSRCHADDWAEVAVERGVVEESTTRLHRTHEDKRDVIGGWTARHPVVLASVRTDLGLVVIARVGAEVDRGTVVQLSAASGGVVAEPLPEGAGDAAR